MIHTFPNGKFVVGFFYVNSLLKCRSREELCGLSPNFHIHVSVSDLYIPRTGLIWNLYFPVLHERTLGSTACAERRAGLAAVPFPLLHFCSWAKICMLVIYVNSRLNCRRGKVGRELLAANPLWQFPFLLSAPAVELRVLSRNTGKYINRSQTHGCGNWDWSCTIFFCEYINGILRAVNVQLEEDVILHFLHICQNDWLPCPPSPPPPHTVLRDSRIQNKTVDGWKRATVHVLH
jgi:hypothetical protein